MIKVFFAHSKQDNIDPLYAQAAELRLVIVEKMKTFNEVKVILGFDDYRENFPRVRSWNVWTKDISMRKDMLSGEFVYSAIVVPFNPAAVVHQDGERRIIVGKGTAAITANADIHRPDLPVYAWPIGTKTLYRIRGTFETDREDYKGGYAIAF